jgi:predicted PurR-regulated permease PerM
MSKEASIGYYFIVMASVVIVLAGVKFSAVIIVPFLLSLFIAIILSPAYSYLVSKKIPQSLAITFVMFLFIILLALIGKLIGSSVHEFTTNIDEYTQKLFVYYKTLSDFGMDMGLEISSDELSLVVNNTKEIMKYTTAFIQGIGSLFTNGFVVLLTVVFMLLESKHFAKKIEYADKKQDAMKHIEQIFSQIKNYMVIKTLISLLTGFIIWISLKVIGTDYAFLWGVLAFLLNFIPNIGSIIAAVPAVLITLVQLGGVSAFIVAIVYVFVNIVVGSIIEPKIMGKGLGLSTLVVFLSLIFWGWLLGMVGMLLSIPLTIMAKIIFSANQNTRWIAVLLGTGDNLDNSSLIKV